MGFVSIKDPKWFSYQDVLTLTDLIEFLVFRRVSGQRAPLEEVIKAYLRTMEIRMDHINTHGKSFHYMVENPHKWEHVFKDRTPGIESLWRKLKGKRKMKVLDLRLFNWMLSILKC